MTCGYCGTELPATALFCGECGRSLAAPAVRRPAAVADTAILTVVELEEIGSAAAMAPDPTPVAEPPESSAPPPITPVVVVEDPMPVPAADSWHPPARLLRSSPPRVEEDIEKTRIVSNALTGQRFVLQFSTGESVTVVGTGIVGRNPVPEPAEYFDHVVTIVDPGKSVSKTHLEFGQAAGSFWVSDRFSGNGTVIREPDALPRRCDPGKHYRIARGTRVTMGEQFFVVS